MERGMHLLRESEKLLFVCSWEVGEGRGRGKERDCWTPLAAAEQQVSELPPFPLPPLHQKRTFVEVSQISSLLHREFHVFFLKHEEERGRGQGTKSHVGVVFLGWDSIFAVYETA